MAGYRSLLAFWMGGAGAVPSVTPTVSSYIVWQYVGGNAVTVLAAQS